MYTLSLHDALPISQRVKLASFLGKGNGQGKLLFIFDEPTTGLHFHDIRKLLSSFNALIEQGHSIIVIEHNTDVIKSGDWVIDLGPEAGDEGGNLVSAGTPGGLKKVNESWTGKYVLLNHTSKNQSSDFYLNLLLSFTNFVSL